MNNEYLNTVINDIEQRASKVILNDDIEVDLLFAATNEKEIEIISETVEDDVVINNLKLLTNDGVTILERDVNIEILKQDFIEFTFEIGVGESQ